VFLTLTPTALPQSLSHEKNSRIWCLKNSWMARNNATSLFISAKNKVNIDEFKELVYERVKEIHVKRYPYNDFLY